MRNPLKAWINWLAGPPLDKYLAALDRIAELQKALDETEQEASDFSGFIDSIDTTVSEALVRIGKFPGKPAGMPDRVDALCEIALASHKDHTAMNLVRQGRGDVKLIFVVVGGSLDDEPSTGFECDLYQGRESNFDSDPADALIGAVRKFRANNPDRKV